MNAELLESEAMDWPAKQEDKKYNYGDYLTWPDNESWEIIDGLPYNMSPAPTTEHQLISMELSRQFSNYLIGKPCKVFHAPFDVRLPYGNETGENIETVVQPDLLIVCDRSKIDKKGCQGAPDLVVEIISPDTAKKDLKIKFKLYERAGVKEYWIVDPSNKTILVYRMSDNKYGEADVYASEDMVTVNLFPDFTIDLKEVFRELS
jgi:Uma2 family endonuclease